MAHFRPYLLGAKFVVVTDHRPLVHVRTMKQPAGRMGRWLHAISQFDFEVVYKPGRLHTDADALSRICAATTLLPSVLPDVHIAAQAADPAIAAVISLLRAGADRPPAAGMWRTGALRRFRQIWCQLEIGGDGVLYRNTRLGAQLDKTKILVVPSTLVPDVLQQVHADPMGGHSGVNKTIATLIQRYYWPGFSSSVDDYIRHCSTCQKTSPAVPRPKAPLQPIPVGGPFEMIAMDFLELPRTARGNRYVLVVSDYFTRWPEAFATADQKSETVARILMDGVVARHGLPHVLHSDQGPSFESKVIRHLCDWLGIRKTRTTPYHPQGDGLVERFNRTLLGKLRAYCHNNPHDWDRYLDTALGSYRTSTQTSLGASPFELLYGRRPRLPTDAAYGTSFPDAVDTGEHLRKIQARMAAAREVVDATLTAAQDRQQRGAPVHHEIYATGDLVYLHNPGRLRGKAHKLLSVWDGPFRIVNTKGSHVYVISPVDKKGRKRCVHHDRLKRCYRRRDGDLDVYDTEQAPSGEPLSRRHAPAEEQANSSTPPLEGERQSVRDIEIDNRNNGTVEDSEPAFTLPNTAFMLSPTAGLVERTEPTAEEPDTDVPAGVDETVPRVEARNADVPEPTALNEGPPVQLVPVREPEPPECPRRTIRLPRHFDGFVMTSRADEEDENDI